ncbi:MAG: hypothetical protein WCF61_16175 [Terriglobales bacterium]
MNNFRPSLIRRPVIVALVLFTLAVYSYPALATLAKTGFTALPPIFAADLDLYLLISKLTTLSPAAIVNPYYGIEVPPNATAHLKFRLAFLLFRYFDALLGGHLWLALFVWNLFWWGLLCWVALWLFEKFLPDNSILLVALGLGFLMWSNFGLLKPLFLAWFHLPSLQGFENVGLAYARPFFPQLPVPLVLAYLGLQMSLLRAERLRIWIGMGLLQFLAFAIFPYATLMMAGITLVVIFWLLVAHLQSVPWRSLIAYGTFCAAVDFLYLRLGTITSDPQTHPSIFHIELAEVPHLIGGMWIILALLTLATALVPDLPAKIKWPLVGLGLTNLTLLLGDVFFPETAMMLSHHAGYFVHPTVALLLTFTISALCVRLRATARYLRPALGVVVILLAGNAMLMAAATYRAFLPLNQQQAEAANLLQSIPAGARDLLILPAKTVEDPCEWTPLVSPAKVLYCRNAATLLTPNQILTNQRFRQALYLYFTGEESQQIESMNKDPKTLDEEMRLAYFGGIIPFRQEERAQGLSAIRTELIPLLDEAAHQDQAMQALFRQYSRILVVDSRQDPVFDRQRLASYLVIQKEVPAGNLTVLICNPK